MKWRKHHNNKGYRQIKNGKPAKQMRKLAKKLGIPFKFKDDEPDGWEGDLVNQL